MTKRIVVVDDDDRFRDTVETILRAEGYDVVTAEDGNAALLSMKAVAAQAVLLDWSMPGLDGPGFRKAQRAAPEIAGVPVVVLSGDWGALAEARTLGVAAALPKPVALSTLLDTLSGLFESVGAG